MMNILNQCAEKGLALPKKNAVTRCLVQSALQFTGARNHVFFPLALLREKEKVRLPQELCDGI